MNALISINHHPEIFNEEKKPDTSFIGDIFAVSIIGTHTLLTLVISSWSAWLLLTENTSSKPPLGIFVDFLKIFGIV
jgi:hypothetical protein